MKLFTKILFQLIIVAAILLLFSGHFSLQARHEQLKLDFDGHWHYQPTQIPDFVFGKARIFEDERIPYNLTPTPKRKHEQTDVGYCYYYYYGCR